jgi:hypothetical protein
MLDAVRSAAAADYEVLGQMRWEDGGGVVYFARQLNNGKLTALRLQRQTSGSADDESYALGQTQVLTPLARSLGATHPANAKRPPRVTPPPSPSTHVPAEATEATPRAASSSTRRSLILIGIFLLIVVLLAVALRR